MKFKAILSIIKKLRTNFSFRKRVILISTIGLVGCFALAFFVKTLDTNMSASVLQVARTGGREPATLAGDVIIENMYLTPTDNPDQVNIVIKNIGGTGINIPLLNGAHRFALGCWTPGIVGGYNTVPIQTSNLGPNQSITTQIENPSNLLSTMGTQWIACRIQSQQEQGWEITDPNSSYMLYEADGTNNSFTLYYTVGFSGDTCTDTDGGINHSVRGTITTVENGMSRTEQDSCNPNGTLREWFCGIPGDSAGLLRSENYVDCGYSNQCIQGACVQVNDPNNYGYGYGYNGTGGNNGYGYGYGYKKLDPKTKKPYLYLINVFKQYSKSVYDAVVKKLGFQMVKSYNKKEFTPTVKSTTPTTTSKSKK